MSVPICLSFLTADGCYSLAGQATLNGFTTQEACLLAHLTQLALLFICRGERARTMLLHYNKGLVGQFVWRCKRMGTDCAYGELMLAGEEALYKAAIKWDSKKGTRFSTYAFQRVNRAIVGYIMEHEDVIKIPVNLKELQNKIRTAQAKLSQVIIHLIGVQYSAP